MQRHIGMSVSLKVYAKFLILEPRFPAVPSYKLRRIQLAKFHSFLIHTCKSLCLQKRLKFIILKPSYFSCQSYITNIILLLFIYFIIIYYNLLQRLKLKLNIIAMGGGTLSMQKWQMGKKFILIH